MEANTTRMTGNKLGEFIEVDLDYGGNGWGNFIRVRVTGVG